MKGFYGKYRGKVVDNADTLQLGRLLVSVPAVLGDERASWALPCVPYAGKNVGLFALPPKGANLWVEFEGGDPDFPVWTGCFWNEGELPVRPAAPALKVFKTESVTLQVDDTKGSGKLMLRVASPAVRVPIQLVADAGGLQVSVQNAHVKIGSGQIELLVPLGTLKLAQAGVEIKHGSASVRLQQIRVTLNNGAFEVS